MAVSDVSKAELEYIGIPKSKLGVHPNWIETDLFKPVGVKDTTKYKYNLLFVGRLLEKKGIKIYLECAQQYEDICFHVAGGGPEEEYVSKMAKRYPNIKYHGVLMQDQPDQFKSLLKLYQNADFLVSPYTYDEGFSTTLLESLACGVPLILTKRGSPPTFISDSVGFFLSPQPTTQELESLIDLLLFKKTVRIPSPQICRDYALQKFGYTNADIIIDAYEK